VIHDVDVAPINRSLGPQCHTIVRGKVCIRDSSPGKFYSHSQLSLNKSISIYILRAVLTNGREATGRDRAKLDEEEQLSTVELQSPVPFFDGLLFFPRSSLHGRRHCSLRRPIFILPFLLFILLFV
jgi:hypothetical protein